MKVGITGHQKRDGIDWSWVKGAVCNELRKLGTVEKAFSCLAAGTDQVFAEAALSLSIPVVAVIPLEGYESFFENDALKTYQRLRAACEQIQLGLNGVPDQAFLDAGRFIVDTCDLLFAVWDGERAEGLGGTGDVVAYAHSVGRAVVHINPLTEEVSRI